MMQVKNPTVFPYLFDKIHVETIAWRDILLGHVGVKQGEKERERVSVCACVGTELTGTCLIKMVN